MMSRVLGISGSLRRESYNSMLLRAAAAALPPGAEWRSWSRLAAIPPFDEDVERAWPAPGPVADLRRAIAEADAVVISTPEYNASVPGALKNALDWMSRPLHDNVLRGKPVVVMGVSTGLFGAVWALADLRRVLTTIGADVLEAELSVPLAGEAFGADGRLVDVEIAARLTETLEALPHTSREAALG